MKTVSIALLFMGLGLYGCDTPTFDFDFTHSSPEYLIRGDGEQKEDAATQGASEQLPELTFAGGWTSFYFGSGIGAIDSRIAALETLEVRLRGTNPDTGNAADLGFIQRLELYVLGDDGLPSFLLASFSQRNFDAGVAEIFLDMHEFVDILPYTENDLAFQVFLQGRHPRNNIEIQTELLLRGYGSRE